MPWGVVAGAIVGAVASNNAADKGASATKHATDQATAEQQREYDQSRKDQLPFLEAGYDALNRQNAYLNGDTSGFMNSPDYQYTLDQSIRAADRSAAAHGALGSGGHSADLVQLGQGLALQNANNYWNKLAGRAGQGQTSATNLGTLGANMANQIGQNYLTAGQARASSYQKQGQNWAGLAQGLGNTFAYYGGGV